MKKTVAKILAFVCGLSCLAFSACDAEKEDLTVYMPDGAPSLAFAKLMSEDTEDDGITYKVVAPNLIKTKVTYTDESKNADLCVLPLTAATKLLGTGERYQMLGTVTHGNLYLISQNTDTVYEMNNISALLGKTVGVLQLNEVPGLIFKTVLQKAGIAYQENGEPSADKVNLIPITGAQDVGALESVDAYLLAEPAVTAQKKKGFYVVGDVQALYGGENGYPQAVLVAKKSVLESDRLDDVVRVIAELNRTHDWLSIGDASGFAASIVQTVAAHLEDSTYSTSLAVLKTLTDIDANIVIQRCGVYYQSSGVCKDEVTAFLTVAQAVNANMATMPSDVFFYNPEVNA